MLVELDEVESYLVAGLQEQGSPWATPASRELFYVFSGYIRHRLDEFRKDDIVKRGPLTDEQVEQYLNRPPSRKRSSKM